MRLWDFGGLLPAAFSHGAVITRKWMEMGDGRRETGSKQKGMPEEQVCLIDCKESCLSLSACVPIEGAVTHAQREGRQGY